MKITNPLQLKHIKNAAINSKEMKRLSNTDYFVSCLLGLFIGNSVGLFIIYHI